MRACLMTYNKYTHRKHKLMISMLQTKTTTINQTTNISIQKTRSSLEDRLI